VPPDGGFNWVDVRDIVEALLFAEAGVIGWVAAPGFPIRESTRAWWKGITERGVRRESL